jgi:hypothetical protein
MDLFFWITYYAKCILNLIYAFFNGKNAIEKIVKKCKNVKIHNYLYICHVYGTYHMMGVEYGKYMKKTISRDVDTFLFWMQSNAGSFQKKIPEIYRKKDIFASLHALYLANHAYYNKDVLEYIEGISEATGIAFMKLMYCNLFSDLMDNHCIILSKSTPTGRLNIRTFDYGAPQLCHCVTVFHPTGRLAYLSLNVCFAFGIVSGVSEKNVFFGESYYDEKLEERVAYLGMPFHHLSHLILSQATDVQSASVLLAKCKRQSNLQLLLADSTTARIYVSSENVFRLIQEGDVASVTPHEQANFKLNSHYLDTIENVVQKFIPGTKSGELHILLTHGNKIYISVTTDILQSYNNTFYEYNLSDIFTH